MADETVTPSWAWRGDRGSHRGVEMGPEVFKRGQECLGGGLEGLRKARWLFHTLKTSREKIRELELPRGFRKGVHAQKRWL